MNERAVKSKPGFGWIEATKLVKAAWNYKKDSPELKEKLKANIKRNGMIENILVRELDTGAFEIVNGNHRMDAITELGLTKLFCFNLGKITQSAAVRIAIETNETRFANDQEKFAARMTELLELCDRNDLLETFPFTDRELDEILNIAPEDFDPNEQWKGMPEFANEPKACKTIFVHFKNQSDVEDFAALVGQTIAEKTKYIWHPAQARRDLTGIAFIGEE